VWDGFCIPLCGKILGDGREETWFMTDVSDECRNSFMDSIFVYLVLVASPFELV